MHKIYISAHECDQEAVETFLVHFASKRRRGIVQVLSGLDVPAGKEWQDYRVNAIGNATQIFVLISANYIANDWLFEKELKAISAARSINNTKVMLVPTHEFDWKGMPLENLIARREDETVYFSDSVALELVKQFN